MKSYDDVYNEEGFYWGKNPNTLALGIPDIVSPRGNQGIKLIDLGAGEGRDSIFFSSHGFDVTAVDASEPGLEKIRRWAEEENLKIETVRADINSYELEGTYDIIYSSGSLTFIKPENRDALFEDYRKHTSSGGLHAFNVFINKPSLGTPPDWGDKEYFFGTGELVSYYQDWNVIKIEEETFSCNSGGIPHRHAMETMISVKK